MNVSLIRQFLQYGTVGLCALGVDVCTFTVMRAMNADMVSANVLARFAGAVTAFTGNFLWTFSQPPQWTGCLHSVWRYAAIWVAATLTSTLLLSTLTAWGLPETESKIGVEMFMPILNFFIARRWVFKSQHSSKIGGMHGCDSC
jgi:putative flippase GtrA